MKRRFVVRALLSAAACLRLGRIRLRAQSAQALTPRHLDTLGAIAMTVLPSSLGPAGTRAVVDRFHAWLRDYRAGAEMDHGYGVTRLRNAPASPQAGYLDQLDELDRAARARGGRFTTLDESARRSLVETALAGAGIDGLPQRPAGRHVIADLMGFYFFSSDANDLCYRAAIGRDRCRSLEGSSDAPPRI